MATDSFSEKLNDYYSNKITPEKLMQELDKEAAEIRETYEKVNPTSFVGIISGFLANLIGRVRPDAAFTTHENGKNTPD